MDDIVRGAALRADPASQGDSDGDPIHKIGIVGAGQMGSGIAHVIALSGYEVALHDIAKDKVDVALGMIDKNLTIEGPTTAKLTVRRSPGAATDFGVFIVNSRK